MTAIVVVVGGLGTWLLSSSGTPVVGASGLVFGYATYLLARGFFSRNVLELLVGAVVVAVFGTALLSSLVPHGNVSWQGHLSGGIAGLIAAWALSADRRGGAPSSGVGRPHRRHARPLIDLACASAMRIFSGIQPTGRKHLGNYIGAITQYVAGQDRGDGDLLRGRPARDHGRLRARRRCASRVYDTAATLLAAGLDPERCIFFRQGDVHEHTELCWLLSSVTAFGDLNRMTQFKEKSGAQRELVSAGLFIYPVLQAADVLAYRAHEVPVGEDQRQHVELMRDVAERFNARFGDGARRARACGSPRSAPGSWTCRSPTRKMSTTGGTRAGHGAACSTSPRPSPRSSARGHRLRDRGRPRRPTRPGISNLIEILAAVRGVTPERGRARVRRRAATATSSRRWPTRSSSTSRRCASATTELRADEARARGDPRRRRRKARAIASDTLADVREAMGVGPVR